MCQQLDTDIGIVVLEYSAVGDDEVVVWATYGVLAVDCSRCRVRADTPLAVEVVVAVDIVELALWLK